MDDIESQENFLNSDKVLLIVNLLTKQKIKLWEMENIEESNKADLNNLIMKLSDESGLIESELKQILIKLQKHSLKKLEENKKFSQNGTVVFKLKLIGNTNPSLNSNIFETTIKQTGLELKNSIIKHFNLNCDTLKLIYNGKIIREDCLLDSQDIKNHSTLLVICVYQSSLDKLVQNNQDYKLITEIKDAVGLLTENKLNQYDLSQDLKLQNQNGVSLDLSDSDKRCLTTAILLHEKSKNLIKSKQYLKSLILLAEADNEFKNCQDKTLLENIDNYALLNLDIIWCYLCLENLQELKNAEERICICEKSLNKCYGSDLKRLSNIKGENLNKHTPIFVRLNLLKAILNYHRGKKRECKEYLDLANKEMQKITIDEEKLTQIMTMGFSATEAKLALRASFNDIDSAVEKIFKKKQLQKESKELEKQRLYEKKLEEKYGRTIIGNKPIDLKCLKDLIQFGYSERKAARACIRASNDFNLALDILQTDLTEESEEENEDKINQDLLIELTSMGFDKEFSKSCLEKFKNNINEVVNFLTQNKTDLKSMKDKLESVLKNQPCTSSSVDLQKTLNAHKFLDNLAQEIPDDDEAYLDFNIEEDTLYINKYYSLLES